MNVRQLLAGNDYIVLPRSLVRHFDSISMAIIFSELCALYNAHGNGFYYAQEKLCDRTCLSICTIKKCVAQLKKEGYIEIKKKGLPAQSYYYVTDKIEQLYTDKLVQSYTDIIISNNKEVNNNNNNNTPEELFLFADTNTTECDSNVKNSFIPPTPLNGSEDKTKPIKKAKQPSYNVRADLSYVSEKFMKLWLYWLDYKDEIKKQYKTQRGIESMYKSLVKYSNDNIILAHAIVMTAIEKSYDGFYGLTDKQVEFFLSNNSPYIDGVKEFADIEQPKQETKPNNGGWSWQ